mmetsp:Transcript_48754/g.150548  ORF Transcript_48754/g.150548 Transcript_48754/m.150548 type:complete len:214 (+) Transcript_48754:172-813(+)
MEPKPVCSPMFTKGIVNSGARREKPWTELASSRSAPPRRDPVRRERVERVRRLLRWLLVTEPVVVVVNAWGVESVLDHCCWWHSFTMRDAHSSAACGVLLTTITVVSLMRRASWHPHARAAARTTADTLANAWAHSAGYRSRIVLSFFTATKKTVNGAFSSRGACARADFPPVRRYTANAMMARAATAMIRVAQRGNALPSSLAFSTTSAERG